MPAHIYMRTGNYDGAGASRAADTLVANAAPALEQMPMLEPQVTHPPTFTNARSAGEYCQQTADVFSTNPHRTVVLHRGAICP